MSVQTTIPKSKDAVRMKAKREKIESNETPDERNTRLKLLAEQKRKQRAKHSVKPPPSDTVPPVPAPVAVASSSSSSAPAVVARVAEPTVRCNHELGMTDATILEEIQKSAVMKALEKKPTEASLRRYLYAIHAIQKDLTKESTAIQFELYANPPKIIEAITAHIKNDGSATSLNTRRTRLSALTSILRYFPEYAKQAQAYMDASNELKATLQEIQEQNIAKNTLVDWVKIRDANFKPKLFKSPMERALYAVYTLMPVRRLDYRTATIHLDGSTVLDSGNYLFVNHLGEPVRFQYGDYKSVGTYGVQTIKVRPELGIILKPYIHTLQLGRHLFPNPTGKAYTDSAFSQLVSDLFSRIHETPITVNNLRQSAISFFLKIPNITVADKKEFARLMGHSIGLQALYNKVDDPSGSGVKRRRGKNSLPSTVFPWIFSA